MAAGGDTSAKAKTEAGAVQQAERTESKPTDAYAHEVDMLFVQRWLAAAAAGATPPDNSPNGRMPPSLSDAQLVRLQRSAGNLAVARELELGLQTGPSLQRQPNAPRPAAAPPSDSVSALLDEIAPVVGRLRQPPGVEVITGTSQAEYSRGELEREIGRLWQRRNLPFLDAARLAARSNRGGPRAEQTTETPATEQFGQRWSLNLLAADFQQWSDLPEIGRLLRNGSPYGEALRAEFGRVIPVNNPTAARMRDVIVATVVELSLALHPGDIGQLLVTYSGHGGDGFIAGVDGEEIEPAWLIERGRAAASLGVQLVFVLDTCRAGTLVRLAQRTSVQRFRTEAQQFSEPRRSNIEPLVLFDRDVYNSSTRLGEATIALGDAARQLERRPRAGAAATGRISPADAVALDAIGALTSMARQNAELHRLVTEARPSLAPTAGELAAASDRLSWLLIGALGADLVSIRRSLRQTAVVLDLVSTYINALIEVTRPYVDGARAAERQQPAA